MTKYHISRAGNTVVCKAVKGPCRAQPPADLEQFHSEDANEVYLHIARQYDDVLTGVKRTFPALHEVTDELVGDESTDVSRTEIKASKKSYHLPITEHQLWLRDTEGRPMAFIKVNEDASKGRVSLCDVEVRPEYRGRKLGARLIKATEALLGKPVVHDGGYTPDGLKHIAPLFHTPQDLEAEAYSTFSPMTFVNDWDRAWPKYPF